MSFVLDNSVTMRWCFGDGRTEAVSYAESVLQSLQHERALVPALWPLEVANVLARAENRSLIDAARSTAFIARLRMLHIEVDTTTADHALGPTLDIARRQQLSAYDAAYLELSIRHQLPLATLDADLRRAALGAGIELFAEHNEARPR